jgi:hypothetical protein
MATSVFRYARLHDGLMHGSLDYGCVDMETAFMFSRGIVPATFLRENPLPTPLGSGVWEFL